MLLSEKRFPKQVETVAFDLRIGDRPADLKRALEPPDARLLVASGRGDARGVEEKAGRHRLIVELLGECKALGKVELCDVEPFPGVERESHPGLPSGEAHARRDRRVLERSSLQPSARIGIELVAEPEAG